MIRLSVTAQAQPVDPVLDEEGSKEIDYLMVEDEASLLFVVNLGAIEFHPLHSRCESIERPDSVASRARNPRNATTMITKRISHQRRTVSLNQSNASVKTGNSPWARTPSR